MRIDVDSQGHVVLKEVYSGVMLETKEGNRIGICMRDDSFEINVLPKGHTDHCWQIVNMKTCNITRMYQEKHDENNLKNRGNEDAGQNDQGP